MLYFWDKIFFYILNHFFNFENRNIMVSITVQGKVPFDEASIFFINIRTLQKSKMSLEKEFVGVCEWFVDNKLSIDFAEDITKWVLFSKEKNLLELNFW